MASPGRPTERRLSPFGEILREEIVRSPLVESRSDFARRVPIDTTQLYRYETGATSPRLSDIVRFAEVLGCEPTRLVPVSRAGGAAPYRALAVYMHTAEWDAAPQWQREQLSRYRVPPDAREPTIDTYRIMHTAMKLGATEDDAIAEAEVTEAAERELAALGGRKLRRRGDT